MGSGGSWSVVARRERNGCLPGGGCEAGGEHLRDRLSGDMTGGCHRGWVARVSSPGELQRGGAGQHCCAPSAVLGGHRVASRDSTQPAASGRGHYHTDRQPPFWVRPQTSTGWPPGPPALPGAEHRGAARGWPESCQVAAARDRNHCLSRDADASDAGEDCPRTGFPDDAARLVSVAATITHCMTALARRAQVGQDTGAGDRAEAGLWT
jgi:hypothetical protein